MSLLWFIDLIIAVFLQLKIVILKVQPEFLTAVVFLFGMRTRDDLRATIFGAITGLVEDSLSGFWGPNIISKALVGYLSANILGGFFVWSPILGVMGLFFFTVLDGLLEILVSGLKDMPVPVSGWILYTIFIQALVNAPIGVFAGENFRKHSRSKELWRSEVRSSESKV